MNSEDVEMWYLLSTKGDKYAFDCLFDWFVKQGEIILTAQARQYGYKSIPKDDFKELLTTQFMEVLSSFEYGSVPFSSYSIICLNKRVSRVLREPSFATFRLTVSLDQENDDGFKLYDVIESNDYSEMHDIIDFDLTKARISSKNYRNKIIDKRIKKFLYLKELGYQKSEIMDLMKVTDGQYRYLIRLVSEMDLYNLKFEIK